MKKQNIPVLSVRSRAAQRTALRLLRNGGVLVFPTDTVYGLGCDAFNKKALVRVAQIKGRPKGKPFPVLASDIAMVKKFAVVPSWLEPLPKILWPGSWTFVLPARKNLSQFISRRRTVAIRVPEHAMLRRLIEKLGRPVVGTSANIAGKKSVRTAAAACTAFGSRKEQPDLVLDGGMLRGRPSVVFDVSGRAIRILRS